MIPEEICYVTAAKGEFWKYELTADCEVNLETEISTLILVDLVSILVFWIALLYSRKLIVWTENDIPDF